MGHRDVTTEITVNRIKQITCHQCGATVDISKAKPLSMMDCPDCSTHVRVPAQVDHFLLVKQIARGGSGVVYQAYDENLWRQVALKLIFKSAKDGDDKYEETLREARASAMLIHPNIVQIYSLSEDMGQPYIVMELVDGGSVTSRIKADNLQQSDAIRIARDAARGLAEAHRLKVVHGDIKPENILLTRDGVAKLIDFGLAVRSKKDKGDGKIRGTPYYIAPEVVQGEMPGPPSDIYNLGATLYHALTGKPPFRGKTVKEVVPQRLDGPPPNILDRRPDLSQMTAELVIRMMEVDPADRFSSASELSVELDGLHDLIR